ncbi:MAG: cysteine--tRNA ligase [Maricaulaceae bacterium]
MSDTIQNQPQLTLYNSLSREKEVFTPQNPERVTMYNCGPTVYSYAHIGNARAAVVADVLYRVLRHIYGEEHVVYARNITDVDDKIITSAKEQGVDISVITEKYAKIYNDDLAAIGCLPPTVQPKCTDHIGNMVTMISDLISKDFAYESDGHVFFDVSKYDDYGKLSGNTLENLRGGDRVGEGEVARKRNAADFVLWKPPLEGVGWDAPFGNGRPGWHIECSAMAKAELTDGTESETIDIHCGGVDLKFPHHENEIAQSSCCHDGAPLANYWVHNEFLNMGSEKMSKSLGNVKLIRDLLENWDGEVIRLALLKAHYRSELMWSEDLLKESKAQLDGWYGVIQQFRNGHVHSKGHPPHRRRISSSIFADLASPHHIRFVQVHVNEANRLLYENIELESTALQDEIVQVVNGANLLGLLQKDPEDWFKGGMDTDKFDALVKEYDAVRADAIKAKAAGDKAAMGAAFGRSDEIRDELKAQGIAIETGPDGSAWRKA